MSRHFEPLDRRIMLAVTASFAPATGILTVFGDVLDNNIILSRDAAGTILVNGGAVAVSGGTPSVANTAQISVFAQGGNDLVEFDQTNGALPAGQIQGGANDDTLIGGSGGDLIFGQSGNDVLQGKGGFDSLFGGSENDTLTGGDGDDQVFGESGNDLMVWNPGDDTDLNEGGDGSDTVEVNGGGGAEVFTVTANGTRVRFDRIDPAPFSLDIGTVENLVLNANGGNDSFSCTGNLSSLILITADGGFGNDTLLGSNGIDLLLGGDGDDFIDGQQNNDVAFMGIGNDVFQWDPGDGSDTVEGQFGTDTLLFNGSNGAEIFEASANGGRVLFTRNLGTIVMDLDDVETIDLNTLGNTDTTTVNDLSATDLVEININQAGTIGGNAGDAAADVVIVNGTNGDDIIDVVGAGTSVSVLGLSAQVNITNSEGANDSLIINALGGADGVTATTLPAGVIKLTADGGAHDDVLLGSQGADTFLGGDGADFIFGDNGNDLAMMGAQDDVFQWDPGDGNDTIEGQDGFDTMLFFGSGAAENITISPNGGRVIFFRDVANVTMDMDDVETIDFRALGGTDNIVVGDLSGTDMTQINLDLRGPNGGGDAAADSITVNGTNGADVFGAAGDAAGVTVFGLQTDIAIFFQELANDRLTLNALGEDDVVDATSLEADGIQLTINGGIGDDILIGSEGNDLINGGDGDDTALMGAGNDTFVWNPGDDNDVLEGQGGNDTMLFNGAIVAENITLENNNGRVRFFRDIANVTMDLNDTEVITFNALGGADTINVNSLVGTDVTEVNLNLAQTIGGGTGDAQIDTINVNGGTGSDNMAISATAAAVTVVHNSTQINVTGHEPANDKFNFNPVSGVDTVTFNSMSGIDGMAMKVDLGADGQLDQVVVNFNANGNNIDVQDSAAGTHVSGVSPALTVAAGDITNDSLRINALGGVDFIDIVQSGSATSVRNVLIDAGTEADSIFIANTASDGAATILPSTGDDTVSVNTDGLFQANAVFGATQRIGSLSIGPNGRATIASGAEKVLTVTSLNITSTGKLDLATNSMIVDYSMISPIATIRSLLTSGFANGAWNGNGIISSAAAVDHDTAIGYAEATDLFSVFPATFKGQSINATSILLSHTLSGDTDLNGNVNLDDFNRVAANFGQTNRRWSQGDFDYNGTCNLNDFNRLASNFGQSQPASAMSGGESDEVADGLIV